MVRIVAAIALLISVACLAPGQPQTLSPQNGAQATRAVVVRQRVFSDSYGGIYRELIGPQGRRASIVMHNYASQPNEPFRMSVGPDIAASMGMLSPQEVADLEPPKSLADQLVTFLNEHDIDGMATISKIGFGGDAGTRWREALEDAGMDAAAIPKALELVDALIAKAQNDAKLLTSTIATKPLPVKPAAKKAIPAKSATASAATTPKPVTTAPSLKATIKNAPKSAPVAAAPVDPAIKLDTAASEPKSPVKPVQPIDASSAVLPTAEAPPIGWSSAEVVKPDQLRAGDIVFVYSPYQFVLYQDPMPVAAVLPTPPTFWRMGVVFRVESDTKRFGLSMDYVQARNMRTVWTVVGFDECLEIRRFGSVPYVLK